MSSQELPLSKINVQEPRFNAQGQMLQPQGSTAKLSNAVWGAPAPSPQAFAINKIGGTHHDKTKHDNGSACGHNLSRPATWIVGCSGCCCSCRLSRCCCSPKSAAGSVLAAPTLAARVSFCHRHGRISRLNSLACTGATRKTFGNTTSKTSNITT